MRRLLLLRQIVRKEPALHILQVSTHLNLSILSIIHDLNKRPVIERRDWFKYPRISICGPEFTNA